MSRGAGKPASPVLRGPRPGNGPGLPDRLRGIRLVQRRVRIGAPDPNLTPVSGMVAVAELVDRLGVIERLDARIGPIKTRRTGFSGGQLLVGMAGAQLAGEDFCGRPHVATWAETLRHQLICAPARLVRHAGRLSLRLPPGYQLLTEVLVRIRALPTTP